jgi:hypothetical protein
MKKSCQLLFGMMSAVCFGAMPALADAGQEFLEMSAGCSADAAFTFPSITITPFAQVVVGAGGEFTVEKTADGVVIKHVGEAPTVRFPSIVAVGSKIDLVLDRPGATYCIDSAVATVGGHIKVVGPAESQVKIVAAVGSVETN